jgi:predicted small lipoprotein YifL
MKKVLVTALAVLLLFTVTGCFFPSPSDIVPPDESPQVPSEPQEPQDENEQPTAYIDAVTPPTITAGEEVTLQGHGIDTDGTIVAHRWRSDIDGPLGTSASITTNALSVGEHEIYLKVQDNNGAWSEEVMSTVVVTPAEAPIPLSIVFFTATSDTIHLGDTTTLGWEVTGADEVTIEPDIGLVNQVGTTDVSPDETTEYVLTAVRGSQTRHALVEITVIEPNSYSETLSAVPSETSSIFGDAPPFLWPPGMGISVGDYSTDIPVQGFVSFDISAFPSDAVITNVEVDFSSYTIGGTPFADLGCLRVYLQNYGTLESEDFFTDTPTGEILKYCSEAVLIPHDSDSLQDALQNAIGHDRLQVRFQFNEVDTNHEGSQDYVHWDNNELILHIEYESYH